jgi:hypothetical protein
MVGAVHADRRVEVRLDHEARLGREGSLTSAYAVRGTRPTAPTWTAYGSPHVPTSTSPVTSRAGG